jgi:hypothetical protein
MGRGTPSSRAIAGCFQCAGAALLLLAFASAQPGATAQNPKTGDAGASREKANTGSSLLPRARSANAWTPRNVDEVVPPVTSDVPCSLPDVLPRATQRVQELVTNLQQFTATEKIERQEADNAGRLRKPLASSAKYIVEISELQPGRLSVDESRQGQRRDPLLNGSRGELEDRGLAALALIFHPYYASDFEMVCEGLGQWRGESAWQIYFRQRSDRESRVRAYQVGGRWYHVNLKGRAWIAADSYQIQGLETDLAEPVAPIRLEKEHIAIEYRPVQFRHRDVRLWLPVSADVYRQFHGRRSIRRHTFHDFELFSVDTRETIADPPRP